MNSTVFCTFDQQDLADLAMGKLRSSVRGFYGFEYVPDNTAGHNRREDGGVFNLGYLQGNNDVQNWQGNGFSFVSGWGVYTTPTASSAYNAPGRPVRVKITCDDWAKDIIVSKLVNMHAYRITAS